MQDVTYALRRPSFILHRMLQDNRLGRPRYYQHVPKQSIATVHCHHVADTVTTTAVRFDNKMLLN